MLKEQNRKRSAHSAFPKNGALVCSPKSYFEFAPQNKEEERANSQAVGTLLLLVLRCYRSCGLRCYLSPLCDMRFGAIAIRYVRCIPPSSPHPLFGAGASMRLQPRGGGLVGASPLRRFAPRAVRFAPCACLWRLLPSVGGRFPRSLRFRSATSLPLVASSAARALAASARGGYALRAPTPTAPALRASPHPSPLASLAPPPPLGPRCARPYAGGGFYCVSFLLPS